MLEEVITVNKIHDLGDIYTEDTKKGMLYIDGKFVCKLDYLTFGYDINSAILKECDVNDKNKVLSATSKMWRYSGCISDILMLIEKNVLDIKYVATVNYKVTTYKDYDREIDLNLMLNGKL